MHTISQIVSVLFPRCVGIFTTDIRSRGARAVLKSKAGGALVASAGRPLSRSRGSRPAAGARPFLAQSSWPRCRIPPDDYAAAVRQESQLMAWLASTRAC
jgi:hypothetical protein